MGETKTQPKSGQNCPGECTQHSQSGEKLNIHILNRKTRPLPDMLGLNLGTFESVTDVHLQSDGSLSDFTENEQSFAGRLHIKASPQKAVLRKHEARKSLRQCC